MAIGKPSMEVLQKEWVSPPPGSVPGTTLPLSFFDVCWLPMPPVQCLLFYELPISARNFQFKQFPTLAHALSLSLQLFYPLAGNLTRSRDSEDHVITYGNGDGVWLTLAQSEGELSHLVADGPRDVTLFHHLVPRLVTSETEGEEKKPLLALQLTIFPGSGICMGVTLHHVVADGSSTFHFMKSWASIFLAGGGDVSVVKPVPLFDRTLVGDVEELKRNFLTQLKRYKSPVKLEKRRPTDRLVLSSFPLSGAQIQKLRDRVSSTAPDTGPNMSKFMVACAYIWCCLVEARGPGDRKNLHFGWVAGCRARLNPPVPVPYFGNCIRPAFVQSTETELRRATGLATASAAIQRGVWELDKGVLKGATSWTQRCLAFASPSANTLTVAGSPKLRIYETDFGWGPPRKVEIISIESTGAMSLLESRGDEEGLEIGLVGSESEMENFAAIFKRGIGPVSS
ncbi:phenolic glucoside malonyltransferase 1-like [Aristolochia californica]|uniref:phenolic glucoside malonyltransferase 1-like n=1 Tax=Aristolochia californica TaxID=171875 RepID=UPI0035D79FF0